MPTPVFVCGAECNIAVVGTVSGGTEHFSAATGTAPTVSTTTFNSAGGGIRSFRFNPSAAQSFLAHTFVTAIASPATMVARFYVRFATLPSASTGLFVSNGLGVYFNQSDSTLRAGNSTGNVASSGAVVTTGVWYRVDVRIVTSGQTVDIQVDGVAQTQWTAATFAQALTAVNFGIIASTTADAFIDDLIVSGTGADYPIGAGSVAGLYPSADGTHGGGWAAGVFGKGTSGATNASNTDTDLWTNLDNPLVTTAAGTWLSDLTGTATSNYVEVQLADLPANAATVNGVMFVATTHSASTTANNFWLAANDSGGTNQIMNLLVLNVTTITVPVSTQALTSTSVPWTPTTVNSLKMRFSSTDTNPDVFLDGVCAEVDYVPALAVTNVVTRARVAWTG